MLGVVLGEVLGVVDDGCWVVEGVELVPGSEDGVLCAIATPVHSTATDVKYANFLMALCLPCATFAVGPVRAPQRLRRFPPQGTPTLDFASGCTSVPEALCWAWFLR